MEKEVRVEGFDLWNVLPLVCGGLAALTVQPAIRVRLTLVEAGSHCAVYEHVEASERTQSPSGSLPRGADGRAPLTKALALQKKDVGGF